MRAPAGTPLYVHLPFCVVKCSYCDFYSVEAAGQDVDGMVEAILAEARRRAPREPRSVFLGGGTPSLLDRRQLRRLLDGLEEITGFRGAAEEVTAECNPESLDRDKAAELLDLGVGRLSVGIQSLDPAALRLFGRAHDATQGLAACAAAREAGVRRLSVDLIYAWPGQTRAGWERDLERVLDAAAPEHFSAYNLTFEPGTPLMERLARAELERPPEELELELFAATRARAAERGFEAYEVSNFSLSGRQCRHNVNYWRNGPYLGLGPSAVSKIGFERSGNPRSLRRWLERVAAEEGPVWSETPPPAVRLGETWWLGLRLAAGVDPAEARATAGWSRPAEDDPAPALADELSGHGLLERAGSRYRLSERGLPVADAVAVRFLERCRRAEIEPGRGATAIPARSAATSAPPGARPAPANE